MASPAALPATGGVKNEAEVDATSFSGPRNPQTALVQTDAWTQHVHLSPTGVKQAAASLDWLKVTSPPHPLLHLALVPPHASPGSPSLSSHCCGIRWGVVAHNSPRSRMSSWIKHPVKAQESMSSSSPSTCLILLDRQFKRT